MIYLDNSATTLKKPDCVKEAVWNAMEQMGNSGRGGYQTALSASRMIYQARMAVSEFFDLNHPSGVVFTSNATEALNTVIQGLFSKGDHVITTVLEHNSVLRPLYMEQERGVELSIIGADEQADVLYEKLESAIKCNTKAVVCTHGSNVTGNLVDIKRIGAVCRAHQLLFIVDASQSAGCIPISMKENQIDILCFTGHKSLFGTMGTGVLALADGISPDSLTEGGTGSHSFDPQMPPDLPDRLEAGTLNNPGILSLGAGVRFIEKTGWAEIHEYEMRLTRWLYEELAACPGIKLYTSPEHIGVPVLSFNVDDRTSEETAAYLAARQIAVRGGYHCAPCAHRFFGTDKRGTVRVSPGVFTGMNECEYFLNSVKFRE